MWLALAVDGIAPYVFVLLWPEDKGPRPPECCYLVVYQTPFLESPLNRVYVPFQFLLQAVGCA